MQRVVRALDPELPVNNLKSMDARIDQSLLARRSPAMLAGVFAAIALLLTTMGTYGVLSYAVAQRRREIALRVALGARPDQVRAQFIRLAGRLLAAGTALGLAGAWMTGRAAGHPLPRAGSAAWRAHAHRRRHRGGVPARLSATLSPRGAHLAFRSTRGAVAACEGTRSGSYNGG